MGGFKIYVATSFGAWKQQRRIATYLREHLSAELTYDWSKDATAGRAEDETPELMVEAGARDLKGVVDCDVLVVLLPGGRGTHFEMGVASALGKPVVIWSSEQDMRDQAAHLCPFHFLPGMTRVPLTDGLEGLAVAVSGAHRATLRSRLLDRPPCPKCGMATFEGLPGCRPICPSCDDLFGGQR